MNIPSVRPDRASASRPNPASTRLARRRMRTRDALLAAGLRLFARQGYHAVTVVQITQAADVGVGTFYLYFRDKEDLLETVVREGLREVRQGIEEAVAGVPPERRLAALVSATLRLAVEHLDLFRVLLASRDSVEWLHRAYAWLAEALATAFPGPEGPLTGRLVAGMVGQAIAWRFSHDAPGPEELAQRVLALLGGPGAGARSGAAGAGEGNPEGGGRG
jgi:AcrR family transcriptional regulator